jgi:diacylglycerol kinase (ATP)
MSQEAKPLVGKTHPSVPGRLVRATVVSLAGLRSAWIHEAAFRQECWAAAVLLPTALWLGQDAVERALLMGVCLLVLIVELLNSAIEAAVDRVGTDHHLLAGRAKDLGSAAVFMSLVLVCCVWGSIAWDRFV